MAIQPYSRHQFIYDILFHRLSSPHLELELRNYINTVINCTEQYIKKSLSYTQKTEIENRLKRYCVPILKEALIEKTFHVFRLSLNNMQTSHLSDIANYYKHRIIPYYRLKIDELDLCLGKAVSHLNQKKEIGALMKMKMSDSESIRTPLLNIGLEEILGIDRF